MIKQSLALDDLLRKVNEAKFQANIVLLDCCRARESCPEALRTFKGGPLSSVNSKFLEHAPTTVVFVKARAPRPTAPATGMLPSLRLSSSAAGGVTAGEGRGVGT